MRFQHIWSKFSEFFTFLVLHIVFVITYLSLSSLCLHILVFAIVFSSYFCLCHLFVFTCLSTSTLHRFWVLAAPIKANQEREMRRWREGGRRVGRGSRWTGGGERVWLDGGMGRGVWLDEGLVRGPLWANWEEKTGFCDAGRKITLARFSVDFTLHQTFIGL